MVNRTFRSSMEVCGWARVGSRWVRVGQQCGGRGQKDLNSIGTNQHSAPTRAALLSLCLRSPRRLCCCSLSPQVGVRVEEEDPRTGARHHCCRCGAAQPGRGARGRWHGIRHRRRLTLLLLLLIRLLPSAPKLAPPRVPPPSPLAVHTSPLCPWPARTRPAAPPPGRPCPRWCPPTATTSRSTRRRRAGGLGLGAGAGAWRASAWPALPVCLPASRLEQVHTGSCLDAAGPDLQQQHFSSGFTLPAPPCSTRRRDARLAAREHLRSSLEQVALQGTELRLRPITHLSGQPTLPPALRVTPSGERQHRRDACIQGCSWQRSCNQFMGSFNAHAPCLTCLRSLTAQEHAATHPLQPTAASSSSRPP